MHLKEIRQSFDPVFIEMWNNHPRVKKLTIGEFTVYSEQNDFVQFRDDHTPGAMHVLYAINKFNEGLHIDGLNVIIMLRLTERETVYFQQIGRVLSISGNKHPMIIDFVNNFKNMNVANQLWNGILPLAETDPAKRGEYN